MSKLFFIFTVLFLVPFLLAGESDLNQYPPLVQRIQHEIQTTLNRLDGSLEKLASRISGNDLRSFTTRKMLYKFCQDNDLVIAAGILDKYGKIITIEPGIYKKYQGKSSGYYEKRYPFQAPNKPFLTRAFRTLSSYFVVTLIYPIHDLDHNWLGSVGIVFQPDSFFTSLIKPVIQGFPVDTWVIETDGTQIYDPNPEEISRNVLTDPLYESYPELRKLAKEIVKTDAGSGEYKFLDSGFNRIVSKKAYWSTVELHGTQWRVVLTRIELGDKENFRREFPTLVSSQYMTDLRNLASDDAFLSALCTRRKSNVISFMEEFYLKHPGIRSIQWIDPLGVNKYGHPEENSLKNYDFSDLRFSGDQEMLQAVRNRKESTLVRELYEGKTGKHYMTPVFAGEEYLGMLYFVQIVK